MTKLHVPFSLRCAQLSISSLVSTHSDQTYENGFVFAHHSTVSKHAMRLLPCFGESQLAMD
jgi:hypothetical protein